MEKQVFIAREQQLLQLNEWLQHAFEGHGRVCFISGEAGSGKSTLVNKFTEQAQARDNQLAVAFGICDAHTGIGDAYLPFREVMEQFTGDVVSKLAQGTITQENASRLKNLLVLVGQAIVEVGPDLIGVFVPGVGLATKLGAFVAGKAGWLDKLDNIVKKPKAKSGETDLQESHIFEQYANVLCRISEKTPLLIILDDLHWADMASINLLFHLGRRIAEHKILIIGTYRCAEVAIGRGGERHPLEKVLAEFKRYFGDITLDLDKAVEEEGVRFVSEFLASEPNELAETFKRQLYLHTNGHPLFTVELLRNMQECGDLVKDINDRWLESESLDWNNLPTRVEGVIEERIGRLQDELKQTLTIGSVQGEDFTAEVVARVQQAEVGGLIRKLSNELERQHRLVHSDGIKRLGKGGQRLSYFRFQHNLFRTYLYNELSEAERSYLHEDIGKALEALYGEQADEIAVQLALHYKTAELNDKARYYLQKAGEQAAERYANNEAIDYYEDALSLTPEGDYEARFGILLFYEKALDFIGERELQIQTLEKLSTLAEALGDTHKLAEVFLRKAIYYRRTSNFPASIIEAQRAIDLVNDTDNPSIHASAHYSWADSASRQGDYKISKDHYEQALNYSKLSGLTKTEADSYRGLGNDASDQSNSEISKTYFNKALSISSKNEDALGVSLTLVGLGKLYCNEGDYSTARQFEEKALTVFREIGDIPREATTLGNLGVTSAYQGDLEKARDYFIQSRLLSRRVGNRESECRMIYNIGAVSLDMGDLVTAMDHMEMALKIQNELGMRRSESITLNTTGKVLRQQGNFMKASNYYQKSMEIAHEISFQHLVRFVLIEQAVLAIDLGKYENAEFYLNSAYDLIHELNDKGGEADVFSVKGILNYHLGQKKISQDFCLKAIAQAKEIGELVVEADAQLCLGHVYYDQENIIEAKGAYEQSAELRNQIGQTHRIMDPQAGLAQVAMKQGKLDEALEYVKQILDFNEEHTLDGTDEPMRIYLTCYQTLAVNHDPRAKEILSNAHTILMQRADLIKDVDMRISYLENVATNREINKAFANLMVG